jgi:hypothetical protein
MLSKERRRSLLGNVAPDIVRTPLTEKSWSPVLSDFFSVDARSVFDQSRSLRPITSLRPLLIIKSKETTTDKYQLRPSSQIKPGLNRGGSLGVYA